MTPMPPACAMAIAISASVTVSMAEATIGMLSAISRVMRVRMSTSDGSTSDRPGLSRTSSKVSASRGLPLDIRGHRQLQAARFAASVPGWPMIAAGCGAKPCGLARIDGPFWVGGGR